MPKEKSPAAAEQPKFLPDLPYNEDQEGQHDDDGGALTAKDKVEKKPVPDEGKVALEKQIEEQKAELAALREANLTLMATPIAKVAPTPPPEKPNLKDLPDPTLDGEAYGAAVAERIRQHDQQVRDYEGQVGAVTQERKQRLDSLWEDFQLTYEDYADDMDKVSFAATKVVQRAMARGIDPDRYMFTHADRFMRDVVKEMDGLFGGKAKDDDLADPTIVKRTANRTDGVLGGNDGGKPANANKGQPERPASMFSDIKKFQQEHGFYR